MNKRIKILATRLTVELDLSEQQPAQSAHQKE